MGIVSARPGLWGVERSRAEGQACLVAVWGVLRSACLWLDRQDNQILKEFLGAEADPWLLSKPCNQINPRGYKWQLFPKMIIRADFKF